MKWSEFSIGRALAHQLFNRKNLVVVPNCIWTGHECDILAVTNDLRLIDVEIKISRSDLKADAKKDKWWHREFVGYGEEEVKHDAGGRMMSRSRKAIYDASSREWPPKVWKHYYALPKEIWTPALANCLPSKSSGILLLDVDGFPRPAGDDMRIECIRRAKPDLEAKAITARVAVDVARLASLRMWEVDARMQRLQAEQTKETA